MLDTYCSAWGLTFTVVCLFSDTPLGKNKLSLLSGYPEEIASDLVFGAFVHFLSQCWYPICLRSQQTLYMLLQSEFIYHFCCVLRHLFLVPSILSGSYILSTSFPTGFCVSLREEIEGDITFNDKCPKASNLLYFVKPVGLCIYSNLLQL